MLSFYYKLERFLGALHTYGNVVSAYFTGEEIDSERGRDLPMTQPGQGGIWIKTQI